MQPRGEGAGIALDEVAEKALHGPGRSAMHHHRALPGAILRNVFEIEPLGKLEIDLHGRVRELPAMRVVALEVDLRSVEGRLSGDKLVRLPHRLERLRKRRLRLLPLRFVSKDRTSVG